LETGVAAREFDQIIAAFVNSYTTEAALNAVITNNSPNEISTVTAKCRCTKIGASKLMIFDLFNVFMSNCPASNNQPLFSG